MEIDWDYNINQFDNKIYYGNPLWKNISHIGIPKITNRFTCGYCNMIFESRNQIFKHLGYLNIDIRHKNGNMIVDNGYLKKKKYRKKKRRFFKTINSCSDLGNTAYTLHTIQKPITMKKKQTHTNLKNLFDKLKINSKNDINDMISNFKKI